MPTSFKEPKTVDFGRLSEWMDEQGMDRGPIEQVERLSGGSQNILVRFTRGGRSFVLRRPPANLRPESNATMRREARVLAALRETAVPHPHLIAACDDQAVLGAVFYLMEPIDGFCATAARLPEPHASDPGMRRRMGFALADGAALLAGVDWKAKGLTDFGKPDGYLQRQVSRWRAQLEGYRSFPDWPGRAGLPQIDEIAAWLNENRPLSSPAALLHGDYSIGNVLFHREESELAAIVDWELATIGDPLVDLGWLLATWRDKREVDIGVLRVEPFAGFPTGDELVARYAEKSGRDVSAIGWYVVLACYKLAILLEGTFARACAGLAPVNTGRRLHNAAERLLVRACARIERT